jgi:TonB family protein
MFAEVRKSVLPGIVQRAYAEAKAAFDRKDPDAAERFDRVLELLKDPDVASDAALADLKTVASGFRDLSQAGATSPAATPAVTSGPPPVTTTAAATARRPSAPPAAPSQPGAPGVIVPPVAITQIFPSPSPQMGPREWDGEVELVIDQQGKVQAARMTKSIHPSYDQQLLRAARTWTYRPATRDGIATQMVKLLTVHLDTRPECTRSVRGDCRPVAP